MPEQNTRTLTIETNASFDAVQTLYRGDTLKSFPDVKCEPIGDASAPPKELRLKQGPKEEDLLFKVEPRVPEGSKFTITLLPGEKFGPETLKYNYLMDSIFQLDHSLPASDKLKFDLSGDEDQAKIFGNVLEAGLKRGPLKPLTPKPVPTSTSGNSSDEGESVDEEEEEEEEEENSIADYLRSAWDRVKAFFRNIGEKISAFFTSIKNRLFGKTNHSVKAATLEIPNLDFTPILTHYGKLSTAKISDDKKNIDVTLGEGQAYRVSYDEKTNKATYALNVSANITPVQKETLLKQMCEDALVVVGNGQILNVVSESDAEQKLLFASLKEAMQKPDAQKKNNLHIWINGRSAPEPTIGTVSSVTVDDSVFREDAAFQQACNEKVKEEVAAGRFNTDFSLSKAQIDRFKKIYDEKGLHEKYLAEKTKDEAKYKFKLASEIKDNQYVKGTIYCKKIDDNTLEYRFFDLDMNSAKKDEAVVGRVKVEFAGELRVEAADFVLVDKWPETPEVGKLYFLKDTPDRYGLIQKQGDKLIEDTLEDPVKTQILTHPNKDPRALEYREDILKQTSKKNHTPKDYLARFKSSILEQIAQNGHIKREELIKAKRAYDERPKEKAFEKRYTRAFTAAIAQFGKGKDFTVNGLSVENIKNVRGQNNNCGANSMFHIMLENLEFFSWDTEPYISLLDAMQAKLVEKHPDCKDQNDIPSLKKNIMNLYKHEEQDEVFGPIVRAHIAKKLKDNAEYKKEFIATVLPQMDPGWDLTIAGMSEFAIYKVALAENKTPDSDAETRMFNSRYDRLGVEANRIMITEYELAQYAKMMRIDLRFYAREERKDMCVIRSRSEILNKDGKIDETKVKAGNLYLAPDGKYVVRRSLDGPIKEESLAADVVAAIPKDPAAFEKWINSNDRTSNERREGILAMIPEDHLPDPLYVLRPEADDAGDKNKFEFVANVVNIDANHWQYDVTPSKAQRAALEPAPSEPSASPKSSPN